MHEKLLIGTVTRCLWGATLFLGFNSLLGHVIHLGFGADGGAPAGPLYQDPPPSATKAKVTMWAGVVVGGRHHGQRQRRLAAGGTAAWRPA